MAKRTKALKMTISTRQRIGKFREDNPKIPITEIAEKFNCTYQQARKAIEDWKNGNLSRPRNRKSKNIEIADITTPPDTMLENQFRIVLGSLESNLDLTVDVRTQLLDKCFSMRKQIQSLRLEHHIKRADAALIAIIIRKYEPTASDDRVLEIYQESLDIYRGI